MENFGWRGGIAKFLLLALLVGAFTLTTPAALILQISDGTTTTVIEDGGVGDASGVDDVILFNGVLGVWSVNVTTGIGSGVLGSPNYPQMDLNSVNVSTGAGTLTMYLIDTDLLSPIDPLALTLGIGGTTQGSVISQACFDPTNNGGGNATCPGTVSSLLGPFTGGAFSGQTTFLANGTSNGPFALKLGVSVTHDGAGVTSFDANLNSVPEPSTLFMSGIALLGLGGMLRHRAKKEKKA